MKNVKMKYVIWLLVFGLTISLNAQTDRILKGRVVDDETGEGLPGAAILVKGLGSGTVTDGNGNFTLQLPEEGGTLEISYIGFVSQKLLVMNQTDVVIRMPLDITSPGGGRSNRIRYRKKIRCDRLSGGSQYQRLQPGGCKFTAGADRWKDTRCVDYLYQWCARKYIYNPDQRRIVSFCKQ